MKNSMPPTGWILRLLSAFVLTFFLFISDARDCRADEPAGTARPVQKRSAVINESVRPIERRLAPPPRPVTKQRLGPEDAKAVDTPQNKIDASDAVPIEQPIIVSPEPVVVQQIREVRKVRAMPLKVSNEEISNFIQTLKFGQTIEDREYAAQALGSIGIRRADDPIISDVYNALANAFRENTDEGLLRSTALSLGNLGREEAGPVLANYLSYGTSNSVKSAVVSSLGRLQYRGAVSSIINLLLYDSNTELKGYSAEALGMIGDKSAGYALLSALNTSDGWVRRNTIDALGKLGLADAEYPLLNILNNESDLELREAAAAALRKIKSQ